MGSPVFTINPDDLYNDRFAWTNGKEYLFYIKHARGMYGNWLIGVEAGVDSGYVYIEGPQVSRTPLGLETSSNTWRWLLDGSWVNQPQMRARCLDPSLVTEFFEVEYFDASQEAHRSWFYLHSDSAGFLWDAASQQWTYVSQIESLLALGQPILLKSEPSHPLAAVVNVEHAPEAGWRLTLRDVSQVEHREWSVAFTSAGEWKSSLLLSSMSSPSPSPPWEMLSPAEQQAHRMALQQVFVDAQPGEYLWLWYEDRQAVDHTASRVELLVECLSRQDGIRVFRYFPTNRLDTMTQSILQQNTDLLVVSLPSSSAGEHEGEGLLRATLKGQSLDISLVVAIGREIEGFVWDFIHYKEKTLTAVPACFLYHAAVSMPHVLVYAAEMICLLAGGKPVVMVQYNSPSDHQWKFPLVQKLTRGIVAAKAKYGESFPIDYTVFAYENEETVVFYRRTRRYLVDMLRPQQQAQALHLLPYVDATSPAKESVWREQVYNAAWNGFVLGYPTHFITSYCQDFPNDLSVEEKLEISRQAQRELRERMRATGHEAVRIRLGVDPPVDEEMVDAVFQSM